MAVRAGRSGADEFREFFGYLQDDAFKLVDGAILGMAWLAVVLARDVLPHEEFASWLPTAATIGIASGFSLLLHRRLGFRHAAYLLVAGLTGALVIGVDLSRQPLALYLAIPIASLAHALLGPGVGALVLLAVIALAGLGVASGSFTYSEVISPGLLAAATVGLTALAQHHLREGLHWSYDNYRGSLEVATEAREDRAELARLTKALDQALERMHRFNQAYVEAWRLAEESKRLKSDFAAHVSHELRVPLNLIVGLTELMVQSPESYGRARLHSAYQHDLAVVHRNARHLSKLVDDVLDLARIEAARMNLALQEVDAAVLVREAVEIIRPLIERRGLALNVQVAGDLPSLLADPTRVRQVLLNLVSNAAHFTERGTIAIAVRSNDDDELQFSVADTGVGISEKDIPHVFEAFAGTDATLHQGHVGAGLGLTVSKQFVEMHRGRIWVESETGKGSTFHFCLPIVHPPAADKLVMSPDVSSAPLSSQPRPAPVLIAVTRSISGARLLDRYVGGYRTVSVPDLDQARTLTRELSAQGVVLDSAENWGSASDLPQLAAKLGATHIPVILCPLPGEQRLQAVLDVDGYLAKPVSRDTLLDTLRRFGDRIERILVVDDDHDFVGFMRRMLESRVRLYDVLEAYGGREGLELMRRHQPDLVLLDLVMPDLDGVAVLQRMRGDERLRQIPVVIISAGGGVHDEGPLNGVVAFTKAEGFQPAELTRWLATVLETTARGPGRTPPGTPGRPAGPPG